MLKKIFTISSLLIAAAVLPLSAQTNLKDAKLKTEQENEVKTNDLTRPKVDITLADIWKDYKFYSKSVSGLNSMNDGLHYTVLENGENGKSIVKYAYSTGEKVAVLVDAKDLSIDGKNLSIDAYEFSADENKVLIATEKESIYRRSWKARHFIYDITDKTTLQLSEGDKEMYASFSPSGSKVAYVKANNLFYKDFTNGNEIQVSKDGEYNHIINGASDWVYEEELELSKAFEWSPNGGSIAFYRFDESAVKQWNMKMYDGLYPSETRFKYPKAGEENAKVAIKIYHLKNQQTVSVKISNDYEYLPSIQWTHNPNELAVMSTNRHQNELHINLVDAKSGESQSIHKETSDTYIEMPFDVYFTKDQNNFIIQSEKSGYRHLYMYNMKGELTNQITKGNWPVTKFYGYDETTGLLYFQSAESSPMNRDVYRIGKTGKGKTKLSEKEGTNDADFSNGFKYFINYYTNANTPNYITLNGIDGSVIRILEDNEKLNNHLKRYNMSEKTFFNFKTSEGVVLNAWKILPPNFDKNKKYPVFLTIYGGPGSQTVTNAWGGQNYFWHQLLAEKGYIVVSVDNRGTGARGVEFKKVTYKQLGKYETEDQIEAAKYFASLPYVNSKRIGVQGWSYGGYMSSLCLLKGAAYFKAAIAVAPVTNWRYYDSIYTERYMQTPQENETGYDDNSPINHVEKLEGKYLLVHGTADDNVHFQNTTEMINALVKADKQFDLAIYPNKNHGIYGGNTRYHLYKKMTDFLLENL
ncbi:MAG: S9 family peptidase [Bacteroidetes bacterium]|nr:MAG: S9 family peptidase [Bacteroidota bacterium]MBL1145316.1 S9 family peptidase [Bacteroidota bacterium]MCB0803046.1 S9 family peptidase [Flavobacteriales bacterium]NOG58113.1 S9 family peptidase [Bacteroidota bacterium]